MRNAFDQFNDPAFREAMKHFQRLQNDPGFQMLMRDMQRRRQDTFYEQARRDIERLHNDPSYRLLLKDLERQQNDPAYKAMLDSLKEERLRNLPVVLKDFPDLSQMKDLLKVTDALKARELGGLISRTRNEQIQILLNAGKLQDNANLLRTFEEIERAQQLFDSQLNHENLLRREEIHFNPPFESPPIEKVEPSGKEQVSAEFFLLDLQTKYEELCNELAENEQLALFAAINGFMIKVNSCVADTLNRIRLNGTLGGNETVVIVKQSDFNILFIKELVEPEKPRRKIGFVIEDEVVGDDEDSES